MDLQSALVCVLVFVLSAAVLLLISMFGMREKSYEEALAEQRQLSGGLLGTSHRPKSKEKKQKKAGKKMKEKTTTSAPAVAKEKTTTSARTVPIAAAVARSANTNEGKVSSNNKPHVEFQEPATLVAENAATSANVKKRVKKDKVKPILLNKEKSPVSDLDVSKAPPANHFDKIHPKDDFELLQSHQKEETLNKAEKQEVETKGSKTGKGKIEKASGEPAPQQKPSKAANKEKKQQQKLQEQQQKHPENPQQKVQDPQQKKQEQQQHKHDQQQQKLPQERQQPPQEVQQQQPAPAEEPPVQEQQHVSVKAVPNAAQHQNGISVKDKKKKKSEFNTLQQMTAGDKHGVNVSLLVPLVRKADLSRSEIQILIDLLLNKQHEAPTILDEWSEGRADPVQKLKRQLAEKERLLTEEQEALTSAQAKLREVRAELNSERSRLLQNCRSLEESMHAKHTELQTAAARLHTQNQKIQQLQAQMNEDVITTHKLREELNAMQLQRQQLDLLISQKQEAEGSLQSQLNQLHAEVQEQKNVNTQLNMEVHTVREKSHAEKEMLHERIRQIENQAVHYKNESDQRQELARQLEESRRAYSELEHRFSVAHRAEAELTMRCQQQLEDSRRAEAAQVKTLEEANKFQAEIARITHLHKQQQEENNRLISDLQNQLSSLQAEKSQMEANDAAVDNQDKEIEILNLQNELSSVRGRLQQRETQLNAEVEEMKRSLRDTEAELQTQRNKNDELRKKNWKVMEALNTAESAIRTKQKESHTVSDDANVKRTKQEEQEESRKLLQRLFPDVRLSNGDNWMQEAEHSIAKHITELRQQYEELNSSPGRKAEDADSVDVAQLQALVTSYRAIIEDTEGMLNQLQSHVEHEETKWQKQLRAKDAEIEALKEQSRTQLQAQIGELQDKLTTERQTRFELLTECEALRSRLEAPVVQTAKNSQFAASVNLAGVEQIAEEKARLAEELTREQKRCQELSEEVLRLRTANSVSLPSKVVQNHTANGTSLESAEAAVRN